jgi:quercetin dioxygenase-like cupin family protein
MKISPDTLDWKEGKVKNFSGKELISLANGSLKLVKVAPLSSYPEHIHPDKTEYAFVLEGSPHFISDGKEFECSRGEFFIFHPNTKHAIHNKTNSGCILLIGAIRN